MKSSFVHIFSLLAIVLSSCYNNHSEPPLSEFAEVDNCDLSRLQTSCQTECYLITEDLVCVCRVTSSDREGNFYRSIIVEDESGGAEIKLGIFNSASQYPVGLVIALRLKGCAAMFDNGVMQIGLPPQEHDALPLELAAQVLIDKHIVRSNTIEEGKPTTYNIASLDGSSCGRFVRVENLRHTPLAEDAECTSIVGYHRFTDNDGNAIFTSVSDYADFAASELPSSAVTLQGILYYETVGLGIGKQFVIKPRFADDISISDSTF